MVNIRESNHISGIFTVDLKLYADERGRFIETFRKEWFPYRTWEKIQTNCSVSKAGVLRGLHYHHHQVDYWYVSKGSIRVGMCDLRPGSSTYMKQLLLEIGDENQMGVYIPAGVVHGFLALTDATLIYLVDNYYDGSDENGVAWNDPTLNIPWGIDSPILSLRDAANPMLADIAVDNLPR